MTPEKIAELEAATAAAKQKADEAGGKDPILNKALQDAEKALADAKAAPSQDGPLKKAADKVRKPKTEAEKAAFALKSNAKRARELGLDPAALLDDEDGSANLNDEPDDKPVTVGDLKRHEAKKAVQTALELAGAIEDPDERDLVIHALENKVRLSGNPQDDLATARSIVNGLKHQQIAEEAARKAPPRQHSSGGAPARTTDPFTPTAAEAYMMRNFNLTEKDVINAREAEATGRK